MSSFISTQSVRTANTSEALEQAILDKLCYARAVPRETATPTDWYFALALAVRDRLLNHWSRGCSQLYAQGTRSVGYLSAEYLMGPHLGNNLMNLGIREPVREALARLGLNLDELIALEEEPGLGNGGLGRLAACYLDSMASLRVPAIGYGIRYEYGIFDQMIRNGWQVEIADEWLHQGNPWEIHRPELSYTVFMGGRTEPWRDTKGRYRVRWIPARLLRGSAFDTPILGFQGATATVLRLWRAEAVTAFNLQAFNTGDYYGAVEAEVSSGTLSKILYPNDEAPQGKMLRLMQQYFFTACSLQDMMSLHVRRGGKPSNFHEGFAVQLNDTHPAIGIAEMMRLLIDEHLMDWDTAWRITRSAFSYTNHTLLPEALEKWPLPMFQQLLPRHLEIIFEINQRFLDQVRARFPGDEGKAARLSLIEESEPKHIRMAHLATVGSHTVNGVAALHSELLKSTVLRDFYDFDPGLFLNVTNGVTPRRWIALSNPGLARLITERLGENWICHFEDRIRELSNSIGDPGFRHQWRMVKFANKLALAHIIKTRTGVEVDPHSLFDVQVKRIHEYKRQHLNALQILARYLRLKRNPGMDLPPRTYIFAGKAAPGYAMAKLIIKLIHCVGDVVNRDRSIDGRLSVVFLPDYNVTNAQPVYPAADISEQISTAGKEASGTGNMKFAMNGALTIGTLDGANVEIREEVSAENFFLFGLTAEEVVARRAEGYRPADYYWGDPELREVLDRLAAGDFSGGDRTLFQPLVDSLLNRDEYFVLADFRSYLDCQDRVDQVWRDRERWTEMSIRNTAGTGKFSSDRSIREYCRHIWRVAADRPCPDLQT
jgi:starch phosphorylase